MSAPPPQKFDFYAQEYRDLVNTSVKGSGESTEYFTEYKMNCLRRLGVPVDGPFLDFGAGTGTVTRALVGEYREVWAYEPSEISLEHVRQQVQAARCVSSEDALPDAHFTSAICSGVLHHVPVRERHGLLSRLRRKLRRGGRLYVFEHNPLNPLTRRAVAACPFDDDAVLLWPWQLRPLLTSAGFEVERIDYIVFFPRLLAKLRPLEPHLRRVVLGAQTLSVVRNPG
jgi:SAM-dependent methyltransferase